MDCWINKDNYIYIKIEIPLSIVLLNSNMREAIICMSVCMPVGQCVCVSMYTHSPQCLCSLGWLFSDLPQQLLRACHSERLWELIYPAPIPSRYTNYSLGREWDIHGWGFFFFFYPSYNFARDSCKSQRKN